jgi:hypothetical protein
MNMKKTIWTKLGLVMGIGCAALGLMHLQSSALRTEPAAAMAAVGVPSRSAQQIGGVASLTDVLARAQVDAFKSAFRWLTVQAAPIASDATAVAKEGLFDR